MATQVADIADDALMSTGQALPRPLGWFLLFTGAVAAISTSTAIADGVTRSDLATLGFAACLLLMGLDQLFWHGSKPAVRWVGFPLSVITLALLLTS
ncbi:MULTISPECIES: hypothetical protein [unclassified Nocardioides]|uniref:hypothetical protein n=1 Tax=unclassified Nocardioides TaxID=2615069 RepID=UPI0006F70948|nr:MULTISPECIES: hypothetical protein [unclassified Nocardioides]KQY50957.1 hypothetical protein ASD30_20965 [Nocardioides sp. Root140]KRF14621.1 hypothetical protein ASH02_09940 [Nocardioides sp. Soil796]